MSVQGRFEVDESLIFKPSDLSRIVSNKDDKVIMFIFEIYIQCLKSKNKCHWSYKFHCKAGFASN
jgi:hypothetical protein